MSDHPDPVRLSVGVGTTIVLVAIAGGSVFSVRQYSASLPSLIAAHDRRAESHEVERCRTIAPAQYASDNACRRAWAEQRRRFFRLDQEGRASITNVPTSPWSEPAAETKNELNAVPPTLALPKD